MESIIKQKNAMYSTLKLTFHRRQRLIQPTPLL